MEPAIKVRRWIRAHDVELQEAMSLLPSFGVVGRMRAAYYARVLNACGPNFDVSQHVILKFPQRLSVGANVFINRGTFIAARADISIGDNTLIGPYVIINSGDHLYGDSALRIRDQGHNLQPIVIHEDVWIGAHAVILKGTVLGQGCVVAAGAVVTKDVPAHTMVAGVPARSVNQRA